MITFTEVITDLSRQNLKDKYEENLSLQEDIPCKLVKPSKNNHNQETFNSIQFSLFKNGKIFRRKSKFSMIETEHLSEVFKDTLTNKGALKINEITNRLKKSNRQYLLNKYSPAQIRTRLTYMMTIIDKGNY